MCVCTDGEFYWPRGNSLDKRRFEGIAGFFFFSSSLNCAKNGESPIVKVTGLFTFLSIL